jgi:hypothetical protein
MKTKNLHLLLFIVISFLISCNSTPTEKVLNIDNVNITGDAKENLKVVPGEYTMKVVDDIIVIPIKFELIKKYEEITGHNDIRQWHTSPELGNIDLIPLDKSGIPIPDIGLDFSPATSNDYAKFEDLLNGEVGDQMLIVFKWSYFSKKEIIKRIMEDSEGIEIGDADFTVLSKDISDAANTSSQSSDSFAQNDSEEWDELLDTYEEYIDNYIKILKKVKDGDASVMTEYVEIMKNANELAEKFDNAKDEMSANNYSRFMELQTKMLNAAASLNQ